MLIPVYNAQQFINRCLDSIVKQRYYNDSVEIVIINDGSKDSSLGIIQDYQSRYKNITVISRENKGIGPTRNELIDNAKGRFFWFIDADDFVSDDSLSIVIPLLDCDRYDMLLMSYYWGTEESGRIISYAGEYASAIDLTSKNIYNNSLWTRIYRTKIIKENSIRIPSYIMGEDFDFILKTIPIINAVKCIEQPMYNYMVNPVSAVGSKNKEHRLKVSSDSVECLLQNFQWMSKFDDEKRRILRLQYDFFAIGYLFSLYRVDFPLNYKKKIMSDLYVKGILPITYFDNNKKYKLFAYIVNHKALNYIALVVDSLFLKFQ